MTNQAHIEYQAHRARGLSVREATSALMKGGYSFDVAVDTSWACEPKMTKKEFAAERKYAAHEED